MGLKYTHTYSHKRPAATKKNLNIFATSCISAASELVHKKSVEKGRKM